MLLWQHSGLIYHFQMGSITITAITNICRQLHSEPRPVFFETLELEFFHKRMWIINTF